MFDIVNKGGLLESMPRIPALGLPTLPNGHPMPPLPNLQFELPQRNVNEISLCKMMKAQTTTTPTLEDGWDLQLSSALSSYGTDMEATTAPAGMVFDPLFDGALVHGSTEMLNVAAATYDEMVIEPPVLTRMPEPAQPVDEVVVTQQPGEKRRRTEEEDSEISDGLEDPMCKVCSTNNRKYFDCRRRSTKYQYGWRKVTVRLPSGKKLTKQVVCTKCVNEGVRLGTNASYKGTLVLEGKGPVSLRPVFDPTALYSVHTQAALAYHIYADACDRAHDDFSAGPLRNHAIAQARNVLYTRLHELSEHAMVVPVFLTSQRKDGSLPKMSYREFDADRIMFTRGRKQTQRNAYKKRRKRVDGSSSTSSSPEHL